MHFVPNWMILLLSTLVVLSNGDEIQNNSKSNTSHDHPLEEISNLLNFSMNRSIDPCEDFYAFACSGFTNNIRKQSLPLKIQTLGSAISKVYYNLLNESHVEATPAEMSIRNFLKSCMQAKSLGQHKVMPVLPMLKMLDIKVPLVADNKTEAYEQDPNDLLFKLLTTFTDGSPLLRLDILKDATKPKERHLLTIQSPMSFLPVQLYFYDNSDFYPSWLFLQQHYKRVAWKFLNNIFGKELTQDELEEVILRAINMEYDVAATKVQNDTFQDVTKIMTFEEFSRVVGNQTESSDIDVTGIVKRVFRELMGYELMDDTIIQVGGVGYFENLYSTLQSYSTKDIINYIIIRKVIELETLFGTSNLQNFFLQLMSSLNSIYSDSFVSQLRSDCFEYSRKYFEAKISQLVFDLSNGEEIQKSTEEMAEVIRLSIHEVINEKDWIDQETKEKALKKLKNIEFIDVVQHDGFNLSSVEEVYANLSEIKNDTFLKNIYHLEKFWTAKNFRKLNQVPARFPTIHDKRFSVLQVNAINNFQMNYIQLFLGYNFLPRFKINGPHWLNFGGTGFVIGHEFIHAFDNVGIWYDDHGESKQWWSNESLAVFGEKSLCLVQQYNDYKYPILEEIPFNEGNSSVNGERTLGENIADNGGLKVAFRAYKALMSKSFDAKPPGLSEYTDEQLFFIASALPWCMKEPAAGLLKILENDAHSPWKVRITNMMKNSDDFHKAFKCVPGNHMVAEPRCEIW